MRRAVAAAWLLGILTATPLAAQESIFREAVPANEPLCPAPATVSASDAKASTPDPLVPDDPSPWQAPWGAAAFRIIPEGPKTAANGQEYHPNFSMDLNLNGWIWRSERLYLFTDMRFWGEKPEYGVTNARDGFMGTSKRQFDFSGGAAWNYSGPWEARAFGYSMNNLNRGFDLKTPAGIADGSGLENRYYLSPEYARLGQPGFDVSRANFLSAGYYLSKDLVGNDGQTFKPGLMLRAYLTRDLWDWPCYAFGDATFISESSLQPKLLLFDVGAAVRPFQCCQQCEFRFGVENTADLQARAVQNLWYAAFRCNF